MCVFFIQLLVISPPSKAFASSALPEHHSTRPSISISTVWWFTQKWFCRKIISINIIFWYSIDKGEVTNGTWNSMHFTVAPIWWQNPTGHRLEWQHHTKAVTSGAHIQPGIFQRTKAEWQWGKIQLTLGPESQWKPYFFQTHWQRVLP